MQKNIALGLALALSVAFTAASKKAEAGSVSVKEFKTYSKPLVAKEFKPDNGKPLAAKESKILKSKFA
jgi:hypothetical protein